MTERFDLELEARVAEINKRLPVELGRMLTDISTHSRHNDKRDEFIMLITSLENVVDMLARLADRDRLHPASIVNKESKT